MKFLIAGLLGALAITTQAASIGNIRNLQHVQGDNCLTYSYGKTKACTKCYSRFVLKDGQCVRVSDECRDWDAATGACTTCYDGYQLKDGACVLPDNNGGNGGNELNCYYRQVPIDGKCVDVSDQCKTWDVVSGACLSCYGGYTLDNGVCRV